MAFVVVAEPFLDQKTEEVLSPLSLIVRSRRSKLFGIPTASRMVPASSKSELVIVPEGFSMVTNNFFMKLWKRITPHYRICFSVFSNDDTSSTIA